MFGAAIAERRVLRLVLLCGLYVAQGIPYGFLAVTLGAYLAERGADPGALGDLMAVAMLPWAFKWTLGPLIDRFSRSRMGRRRPWILLAQALMVSTGLALALAPGLRDDLTVLGWVLFAHNACVALQDVSVDALAVDLLPEGERGFANGLMYGSSYLGVMIGGAGLSTVVGRQGLQAGLYVMVAALATIMLLPLLLREREGDAWLSVGTRTAVEANAPASVLEVARNLLRAFRPRPAVLVALFTVLAMAGATLLTPVTQTLLMGPLGWSQEEYGQMMGGVPLLVGLGGCVGGGWLADRLGHKRVLVATCVATGALWLGFAAGETQWTNRDFIFAYACAEQALLGVLSAGTFAICMDVSWSRVAATQFTAYMALFNLSRTVGSKLAGPVSDRFTTAGCFVFAACLQIAVVVWLLPLREKSRS